MPRSPNVTFYPSLQTATVPVLPRLPGAGPEPAVRPVGFKPAGVAGAPRKVRLTHLDGARGFLLLMMTVAHFHQAFMSYLFTLHIGRYSPVFDAEFFVLISGFVCALAYQGAYEAGGMGRCLVAILRRLRWLYAYQVVVTVLALALIRAAWPVPLVEVDARLVTAPLVQLVPGILTFVVQPAYLDILTLYIVLMLFIPVAFRLILTGRARLFGAIVGACWLAAASGVDARIGLWFERDVLPVSTYVRVQGIFNPLSYALPYFAGFYLGVRMRAVGQDRFIGSTLPLRRWWFGVAMAVNVAFAIADLGQSALGIPVWLTDRSSRGISVPGLLSTAAISYSVYFLMNRPDLPVLLSWPARSVRWLFSRRLLVVTGQNSLFLYSLHVPLVMIGFYLVRISGTGDPRILSSGVALLVCAVLIAAGFAKKRFLPSLP